MVTYLGKQGVAY